MVISITSSRMTRVLDPSVECKDDHFCHQRDPNSHCFLVHEYQQCMCKYNYRLDSNNGTGKCVYERRTEEYKGSVSPEPIILCFMGCVVVEAICLLAFHYWKKHRRTESTTQRTCHLQAVSVADVRFHIQDREPVISFTLTPEMESSISDTRSSSPPPYSQTVVVPSSSAAQCEEPPPPYEEAVKQCSESSEKGSAGRSNGRKMSC